MPSILLPISLASAAAAALINLWLALRIAPFRGAKGVQVGHGDNPRLEARMRAQANFIEYTPIVLILIVLIEFATGSPTWLWVVAAAYMIGRILHPFGMDGWRPGRGAGIGLTMLTMTGLGLYAAWLAFRAGNALR